MDRFDVLALIGLICFAVGCGLVFMPLGLIVWGLGLIGLAFMGARNAAGTRDVLPPQAVRKDKG